MKYSSLQILMILLSYSYGQIPERSSPILYDSIIGKTIVIGSQIWAADNLNVDHFRNGDPIIHVKTVDEWKKAGENKQPAWCYYKNKESNENKFGKLYNWFAVADPRGLAPIGWRIPTSEDWNILYEYVGGKDKSAPKLKSNLGWVQKGNGTNESGFSGMPGGYRYYNGYFYGNGNYGFWWSVSEQDQESAISWFLFHNYNNLGTYKSNKSEGLSIRCIKEN